MPCTGSAWAEPGSPDAFPLEATPEMASSGLICREIVGEIRGKSVENIRKSLENKWNTWEKVGKSTIDVLHMRKMCTYQASTWENHGKLSDIP